MDRPENGRRARAAFGARWLPHSRVVTVAVALGFALVAAILAGMWAGRHAAPAESPIPAQVRQLIAGPGRLTVPRAWLPARLGAAGLPGLTPSKSAAVSLPTGVPAWAVATVAPSDHPSLVPLVLRRLLQGPLPPPRETRLGDRVAWLYAGLTTRGGRALELTVQPTTAGVLSVACISQGAAPPARALCGGAVTSASIGEATTLAPGPSVALALGLAPRLEALDHTRVTMRAKLGRAESAEAQGRLAQRLADAHIGAAEALAPLAATAGVPLVDSLRTVGDAYARLATAAAAGSDAAFSASRRDLDAEESRLAYAVKTVSRRIAPEHAPRLPRAASTPASSPSPLLLLLAIGSLVAALALMDGPRAMNRRKTARAGYEREAPLAALRPRWPFPPSAAPARPATNWTCEITWRATLRGAGFQACTTVSGERKAFVLERSPKVEWPPLVPPVPTDELVAAAGAVEHALIEAGWKPAGRGGAWYARRFAWTSVDPPIAARR